FLEEFVDRILVVDVENDVGCDPVELLRILTEVIGRQSVIQLGPQDSTGKGRRVPGSDSDDVAAPEIGRLWDGEREVWIAGFDGDATADEHAQRNALGVRPAVDIASDRVPPVAGERLWLAPTHELPEMAQDDEPPESRIVDDLEG